MAVLSWTHEINCTRKEWLNWSLPYENSDHHIWLISIIFIDGVSRDHLSYSLCDSIRDSSSIWPCSFYADSKPICCGVQIVSTAAEWDRLVSIAICQWTTRDCRGVRWYTFILMGDSNRRVWCVGDLVSFGCDISPINRGLVLQFNTRSSKGRLYYNYCTIIPIIKGVQVRTLL